MIENSNQVRFDKSRVFCSPNINSSCTAVRAMNLAAICGSPLTNQCTYLSMAASWATCASCTLHLQFLFTPCSLSSSLLLYASSFIKKSALMNQALLAKTGCRKKNELTCKYLKQKKLLQVKEYNNTCSSSTWRSRYPIWCPHSS